MDLTAILYAFSYSEYKIMKKKSNDMGLSITCPRVIVFDRLNYPADIYITQQFKQHRGDNRSL